MFYCKSDRSLHFIALQSLQLILLNPFDLCILLQISSLQSLAECWWMAWWLQHVILHLQYEYEYEYRSFLDELIIIIRLGNISTTITTNNNKLWVELIDCLHDDILLFIFWQTWDKIHHHLPAPNGKCDWLIMVLQDMQLFIITHLFYFQTKHSDSKFCNISIKPFPRKLLNSLISFQKLDYLPIRDRM